MEAGAETASPGGGLVVEVSWPEGVFALAALSDTDCTLPMVIYVEF